MEPGDDAGECRRRARLAALAQSRDFRTNNGGHDLPERVVRAGHPLRLLVEISQAGRRSVVSVAGGDRRSRVRRRSTARTPAPACMWSLATSSEQNLESPRWSQWSLPTPLASDHGARSMRTALEPRAVLAARLGDRLDRRASRTPSPGDLSCDGAAKHTDQRVVLLWVGPGRRPGAGTGGNDGGVATTPMGMILHQPESALVASEL